MATATERTLIIVKPDGVQRGLIGTILTRFERRGLKIVAMKLIHMSESLARQHYAIHEGKPFFDGLIRYITSGPVVLLVLEGPHAIDIARSTMGSTNPGQAVPGTIRADFALTVDRNLVHGSDGPESARKEIQLFFSETELLNFDRDVDRWIVP